MAGLSAIVVVGAVAGGGIFGADIAGVVVAGLVVVLSLLRRRKGLGALGLRRPLGSWPRTLALGVGSGVALQAVSTFVVEPVLARLTGAPADLSAFAYLRGDARALATLLVLTWGLVIWIEEGLFRGFLIPALRTALGGGRRAAWAAVVLAAMGFALAHAYQGLTGLGATAIAGGVLGALFVREGDRLWAPLIAHGVANTMALVALYAGWG